MSHRDRARRYRQLLQAISHAFYEHDPDEMGSTIYAPFDEYDDTAERLLRELPLAASQPQIHDWIRETFPDAKPELTIDVHEALLAYRTDVGDLPESQADD